MSRAFHAASVRGLAHRSVVRSRVMSRDGESATWTQSLTPLNDSAPPNLPVVHVAPRTAPVLPVPDASTAVAPEPSSKPSARTGFADVEPLLTVTDTSADVAGLPD